MIQDIIAYIIVGAAVGYTVYSIFRKLKKGKDSSCSDCSCCSKDCIFSQGKREETNHQQPLAKSR